MKFQLIKIKNSNICTYISNHFTSNFDSIEIWDTQFALTVKIKISNKHRALMKVYGHKPLEEFR